MTRPPAVRLALFTVVLVAVAGCTVDAPPAPSATPRPSTTAVPTAAPVPSPTAASTPAWPAALDEVHAISSSDSYSVVWLATATDDQLGLLDAVQDRAEDLGYSAASTPVSCVAGSSEPTDVVDALTRSDAMGAPVYFADASDAELFVTLWGDPVAAVVHDVHLSCDWG